MKNLRYIREQNGLSQIQLQMKTGIDQAMLSRYESGERTPSVEKLLILSRYFGTSVDYLLDLTDEPTPYPPKKAES
ncbi:MULTISPECIES: helix-turn-helix domain-containing protein [Anaerotruncus]|uniref:XRE family transcriptional regulator n=2 Tax=Anaerotruncus TaxID=244127 RepID=A0A498CPE6_9FIRM|nr:MULTISPECIES: helix-turn-helix transcriptional regulator [Anaerotruncus]MBC3938138.1 helix-turn-helix transcriptional regulator [Anaerotruncus massiliensis (ex Togo et al. 2019)]MCQ4896026.1 helix-turn-helix domain-containing protein [Anaerotruncus sp. DFI.9.16]RLL13177.1 XRE family transcriptional regulator [Anaerotruncus massiliensis (ex Liu et al. 2021)]